MITRKLIAALVGLSLAGGLAAEASAATTSAAITGKPAAVQTTTKATTTPAKATPKLAVGGKHVRKVASKLSAKHRSLRLARHGVKRMKIAKTVNGKRVRLSHSLKRTPSKKV